MTDPPSRPPFESGDVLKLIRQIVTGCCSRKLLSILPIKLNHLINDLAKLIEDRDLVIAVAPSQHQARATANVALVFFRPFNDLYVAITIFHVWTPRWHAVLLFRGISWRRRLVFLPP